MSKSDKELGKLANDAYRKFVTKNEAVKAMCVLDPTLRRLQAELMWEAIDAYEDNAPKVYFMS